MPTCKVIARHSAALLACYTAQSR